MRLTRPDQISSVPEIDAGALAAINGSFDTLERLLRNLQAIYAFSTTVTAGGTITFATLKALQSPNGYFTPIGVWGQALTAAGTDAPVEINAVTAGGFTAQLGPATPAGTYTVFFLVVA